ncbi:FCD domain-containing protein [Vibrio gazogenes]|uniref:Transcriptional regulator, GntR family n=1 Tax=Vibrio gazogenes DSM 21264 = NBRC 103151 TaxID=1123492 RepID=A0A1M5A177_VIBGA|nr:FCD domain-containing protein [Vibrio gazogenes]USP13389.1 FCD domain-containing protein [Vibrio gazogenes]SHF24043.1 transcriptional regulator, GntR family [Vibrio gazogenes DSM 21264] [Vibrio gazogenes DSM 21264 = NBRC 103151]SJN57991.1 HTH-type transcriptional regulator LutR [Vibrio gazogenes]
MGIQTNLSVRVDMTHPQRLYQTIGLGLQKRITSGEFGLGDRLPPEREIAEELDVSRSVVREAIIMLELQGFVEVRKGSGVYVIKLPDTLQEEQGPELNRSSDVGPFELLQARQVLESQIASFSALNVTKNEISRLRYYLDQERINLENNTEDYEYDRLFHLTIAEASQNSVLSDIIHDLWERRNDSPMWQQLHSRIKSNTYRCQWLEDHERILLALQKRDPDGARQAMWQHIENVKQTLFKLSDMDDPLFDGYLFR